MWYKIKEDVEYSDDFNFFCQHQARLIKSNITYTFCSRLEGKEFKIIKATHNRNYTFEVTEIIDIWKQIHKEILEGKHGIGELIN
jgi:hypothetical protein